MIRRLLMVAAVVVSMVGQLVMVLPAPTAEAFAGRPPFTGFLTGIYDTGGRGGCRGGTSGGDVLCDGIYPGGADPAGDFLKQLMDDLTYAGGWGRHNQVAVQFIVSTMMGIPPGDPRTNENYIANVLWPDFVAAVRYYDSQRWIDWNGSWSAATENTFWQGDPGPQDVAWYPDTVVDVPSIIFFNPTTGGLYVIKKDCGNPLGTLNALVPPPDYNISLTANALTAESTTSPYLVVPGRTYSLGADLFNSGPGPSEPGVLQVMLPGGGVVCTPGAGCPLSQTNTPVGSVSGQGFRGSSAAIPDPGATGPNWYWNTNSFLPGGGMTATMQFTIPAGAPIPSTFTMHVYYYKGDFGGAVRHAQVDYRVVSERTPGVVGNNADIHAGGLVCNLTATTPGGSVQGAAGAVSRGQYVVSSLGSISNFKSNGTGLDSLKIGSNGQYMRICRPDLVQAAQDYQTAGVGYSTVASGVFDLAGKSGVYFVNGGTVRVHGTISNKVTLVMMGGGDVEIDGAIQINNASYPSRSVPSLGIISSGDILIRGAVTRVDAYLYANGTVDTCMEASSPACATGTLVVNGFLMGRAVALHRLGPLNTNGTPVAEQVTLNPQIYLNPPRLFDSSVDDILLQGQGERRPLF